MRVARRAGEILLLLEMGDPSLEPIDESMWLEGGGWILVIGTNEFVMSTERVIGSELACERKEGEDDFGEKLFKMDFTNDGRCLTEDEVIDAEVESISPIAST